MAQKYKLTHAGLYNELVVKLVEDQLIKRGNSVTDHIHLYLQLYYNRIFSTFKKKKPLL